MIDSTNNSFEEQWQHAFDDTQLTPPASVWEKIELNLEPENTITEKPTINNKPYYFLGGIVVLVLGVFLWFNQDEKVVERVVGEDTNHGAEIKTQIIEKKQVIEKSKPIFSVKNSKKKTNQTVISEEEINDNNQETETAIIEEIPERTLTDSVTIIEPLSIKNIHSEIENPTINLPTDQTPYYVKPTPKPKKKSILKNIKFSAGAGIY
jgi:hypothetical protein